MSSQIKIIPEHSSDKIMSEELSGVTVVIIIAGGVLTFLILFIFAKRQIMRFALRSKRGPHVPIGHDAKKSLKREIERRIDLVPQIVYEPPLLGNTDPRYILCPGQQVPPYYYRLIAVDDVKLLEKEITRHDNLLFRHPRDNLRAYLVKVLREALNGSDRLVQQFCDLYEHARHDPNEFGEEEYQTYKRLLSKLIDAAKYIKSSPNQTPQILKNQAQDKQRNPLDPSKLRPPYLNEDEINSVADRGDSRPNTLSVTTVQTTDNNETSV